MKIAVTGAHGFIGQAFCALAKQAGHTVVAVPRHGQSFAWGVAGGCDALVHLAGRNIASRWSARFKTTMLQERRDALLNLSEALPGMKAPPQTIIVASAIGHYGATTTPATEDTPRGQGFAADLCNTIETTLLAPKNTRVIYARIGVVLHTSGGALAKMLPAFTFGMGGPVGSGTQIISWISRTDVCRALLHCLETPALHGPINLVAPNPCPQAQLAKTLGQALHRPAFLPMPAFAIKLLFGQMGQELLLQSCAVSSSALQNSGFTFNHPTLSLALTAARAPA